MRTLDIRDIQLFMKSHIVRGDLMVIYDILYTFHYS